MRNLYYRVSNVKGFKEVVKTLKEAEAAKAQGYKVKPVLEDAPKPLPNMGAKRKAARVTATKPNT